MSRGIFSTALVAIAFGALGVAAVHAQSLRFAPKGEQPVEVTADEMELQQDSKRAIAHGHAKAIQGDVSVVADELIADYRTRPDGSNEVYRVFAQGNVTMKSTSETATGPAAVYDFDKQVLVLEGDPVSLVSADGKVSAHQALQYWSNEGVAVADGAAFAEDKNQHKLYGDKLIAFFRQAGNAKSGSGITGNRGDINYVQGFGNVRMDTASEIIRAERGAYNIDNGLATLEGSVKVTQGQNQLSGGFATVNVKGGKSSVYGSAAQAHQQPLKQNARVSALIAPSTKPATTPTP
jgi:lipopolysaccharide export system protein LptA